MIKQFLLILFAAVITVSLVSAFALSAEVTPAQAAADQPFGGENSAPAPADVDAPAPALRSPIVQAAAGVVCLLFAVLAIFPLFLVDRKNEIG